MLYTEHKSHSNIVCMPCSSQLWSLHFGAQVLSIEPNTRPLEIDYDVAVTVHKRQTVTEYSFYRNSRWNRDLDETIQYRLTQVGVSHCVLLRGCDTACQLPAHDKANSSECQGQGMLKEAMLLEGADLTSSH
jgi:hypothetical protein